MNVTLAFIITMYIQCMPFPPPTALTLYCPGLGLKDAPCSDCVYDNVHWPKLKKAGCFNADAVAYCTGT